MIALAEARMALAAKRLRRALVQNLRFDLVRAPRPQAALTALGKPPVVVAARLRTAPAPPRS